MPKLSAAQIAAYAYQAGIPAPQLTNAVAIALAESGGNSDAWNNNPSTEDNSVGLWQVNYFNGLYASRTQAYGTPDALHASPALQAKAMASISERGANWTPWTTYTRGAYQARLGEASQGVQQFLATPGQTAASLNDNSAPPSTPPAASSGVVLVSDNSSPTAELPKLWKGTSFIPDGPYLHTLWKLAFTAGSLIMIWMGFHLIKGEAALTLPRGLHV